MFLSQVVCLEIVEPSSGPLFPCFPCKWNTLKLSKPQVAHFSMFPSQMEHLKIVEPSSGILFPCFPRKWYDLKLSNNQVSHFFHVSLANVTPSNCRTLKRPTFSIFPSQVVCLEIVEPSSGPLFPCFPRKWNALKLSKPQVAHFSMFSSQMVCLKIVEPSIGPLFPCFPCKWYASKLSNPQVDHFLNVSIANGLPWNFRTLKWPTFSMFPSQIIRLQIDEPSISPVFPCFPRKWNNLKLSNPQVAHFSHVSLANGTIWNCRTIKWSTFSMFPSQMVCLKILEPSIGPLFPCFTRKWYASKLSNPQVDHFLNVSIANGLPWNSRTLKWPTFPMFLSQMVCLEIVEPSSATLFPCLPRKWYALKLSNPQVAHFFHVSLANGTP